MAKVSELLGDYADPAGESGRAIEDDIALAIAAEMRLLLEADLPEQSVADQICLYNRIADQEEIIAAWEHLNAGERAAWKRYCFYEEWLKMERIKRAAE